MLTTLCCLLANGPSRVERATGVWKFRGMSSDDSGENKKKKPTKKRPSKAKDAEETPTKKRKSDDDEYLTSQQKKSKKQQQKRKTKAKQDQPLTISTNTNVSNSSNSNHMAEKKTRKRPTVSYVESDNEQDCNSDENFLTAPQKRNQRRKKPAANRSSEGSSNNRGHESSETESIPFLRRNPARLSRENSVASYDGMDTENVDEAPQPNQSEITFRTPRTTRKIIANESVSSTKRTPKRNSRESSVSSYREVASDSEKSICESPKSISRGESKNRSKKNLFKTRTSSVGNNEATTTKGLSDFSAESDDNDVTYLPARQLKSRKANKLRPTGKDRIIAANGSPAADDTSDDDIVLPKILPTLDIGDYKPCPWCGALRFGENSYCCGYGTVFIPPMKKMPKLLADLFFDDSAEAKAFRKMILTFNTVFSMASLQRHGIPAAPHGLPVQKVQGVVDAYPSAALAHDNKQPAFANFYVYHGQEAINKRMNMFHNMDPSILKKINEVMEENNDMVKHYHTLQHYLKDNKDDPEAEKYIRMKIINSWDFDKSKLQGHEGIYKTDTHTSKDFIAVFFKASVEQHDIDLPGLMIYPKRGYKNMRPIHYWNQLVDPLCYPLFYPYGEFGYKKNHYVLYNKREKSYWLRLAEYWESNPDSAQNSESLNNSVQIDDLTTNDLEGEVEYEEYANEDQSTEIGTILSTDTTTIDLPNHDTARQHQQETGLEECDDQDVLNGEEDFDDVYSDNEPNDIPRLDDSNEGTSDSGESTVEPKNSSSNSESDEETPKRSKKRLFASKREYIQYQYQQRKNIQNRFLNGGVLGQLHLIHYLTRILRGRFDKIRRHMQQNVKTTKSKLVKVMDSKAAKKGVTVGIATLMSEKVAGSPRWLQEKFENTVALSNKFGPPDCFLTATCNPEWPEIKNNLLPGQVWGDNPGLVNNVFEEKLSKLFDLIFGKKTKNGKGPRTKKGILGDVLWWSNSIEFQQRGPPHAHIVFSLKKHIKSVAQIDKMIQAHIPEEDGELRELVERFMIHSPCEGNQEAYCRPHDKYKKSKCCKKNFPMEYSSTTKFGDRHYPEYYRPNNGVTSRRTPGADNRYVVPYNSALLTAWKGHINIEVISTLRVVKYIFKYLFKGFDRVLVEIVTNCEDMDINQMTIDGHLIYPKGLKIPPGALEKRKEEAIKHLKKLKIPLEDSDGKKVLVYDELLIVQDMRALTSCEAAWDVARLPRHGSSHTVLEQGVHEENEEPLCFDPEKIEEMHQRIKEDKIKTKLKAWFKLNKEDPEARSLTYDQIPLFYTYKNDKWVQKQRHDSNIIVRIATVPPKNREAFAIRILCQNRRGAESFEELRTVDGHVYDHFTDAAKALQLMDDQLEWHACLFEASMKCNPAQMRRLFMQILTNNDVNDPLKLYNHYKQHFFERMDDWSEETKEAHALHHMESYLRVHGKKLHEFKLPDVNNDKLPAKKFLGDDSGRSSGRVDPAFAKKLRQGLKDEQSTVFEEIFNAVMDGNRDHKKKNAFFLQGSGGTGKTVLMKALYYNLLAENKKVVCVAHTGIAASLLPIGSTAHRVFHIPLNVEETMSCQIELEKSEADYLREIDCIIWDEATMTDRRVYEAVHRLMLNLHDATSRRVFAGVHFILAGDWKQTLPIVQGVRSVGLVNYTLLKWRLWRQFELFELTKNRRAAEDPEYAELLEKVGWGSANMFSDSNRPEDELVQLPTECLKASENDVITKVFGGPGTPKEKFEYFKDSAILTVDNKTTFDVNKKVLALLTTEEYTFKSIDTYDEKTGLKSLNPETYHQITPSGMPPHDLRLKVGATVILLRNINVALGLTNGTRLRITEIGEKILRLKHLDEKREKDEVILTKALFAPFNATSREVAFTRRQFPVRLSFCITCNRAQGQTLKRTGLILRSPCFSHGQLYVALSRVRSRKDLFIYNGSTDNTKTNNVVFRTVFHLLKEHLKDPSCVGGFQARTRICTVGTDGEVTEILVPGNNSTSVMEINKQIEIYFSDSEMDRKEPTYDDLSPEMRLQCLMTYYKMLESDIVNIEDSTSMPQLSKKRHKGRYNADDNSGTDEEYTAQFHGSDEERAAERIEPKKIRSPKKRITIDQGPTNKPLRLEQIGNNCYANTAVQVLYRLFMNEIFYYQESNCIMLKLQEVISNCASTEDLVTMDRGLDDPQGTLEKFNNTGQHDSDEYLLYFVDVVKTLRSSLEINELIQDKCTTCETITNRAADSVVSAQVKASADEIEQGNLTTLQDFVCSVESPETILMRCDCTTLGNVPKVRTITYSIPDTTKYICMKFELYTQYGFVRRNIHPLVEVCAFGCTWEPIAMFEQKGGLGGGHYTAYIKYDNTWLYIDATKVTKLSGMPHDMTRIKLVIMEKTSEDYTSTERRQYFATIRTALQEQQGTATIGNESQISPSEFVSQESNKTVNESNAKDVLNETDDDFAQFAELRRVLNNITSKKSDVSKSARPTPTSSKQDFVTKEHIMENSMKTSARSSRTNTVKSVSFSQRRILEIINDDMFEIETEAIVNAANPQLIHGGGVCRHIFTKAGVKEMKAACKSILRNRNIKELPPGDAVITPAFKLRTSTSRAKFVIHTASPRPGSDGATREDESNLRQCYFNACVQASSAKATKIVFPFLGIGIYKYGTEEGISVAIQAILLFFELHPTSTIRHVVFATIGEPEYKVATGLLCGKSSISFDNPSRQRIKMEKYFGKGDVTYQENNGRSVVVATFIVEQTITRSLRKTVKTVKRILSFKR